MAILLGCLLCSYILSLLGMTYWGIQPVLPWSEIGIFLLTGVPIAFGLWTLQNLLSAVQSEWTKRVLSFGVGVALVVGIRHLPRLELLLLAAAGFFVWRIAVTPALRRTLIPALAGLVLMLWTTLHVNYLFLLQTMSRLKDPSLQALDNVIYSFVGIGPAGRFPLVQNGWAYEALENAYVSLLVMVLFGVMVQVKSKDGAFRLVLAACLCYAVAVTVFMIFPAIGPTLYYDDLFRDAEFRNTLTARAIAGMRMDANLIRSELQPSSGYGYFVALPSMHAAMATLALAFCRRSPSAFWMLLPAALGLIVSTVALGHHYIVDTVAGILTALAVVHGVESLGAGQARGGVEPGRLTADATPGIAAAS